MYNIKFFVWTLVFCFYSNVLWGQYYNVDSLEHVLHKNDLTEQQRLDVIADLCWEYIVHQNSKIHDRITELQLLNTRINGNVKSFKVENLMGLYFKGSGYFDKAFYHFHQALESSLKEKDTSHIVLSLFRLGDLSNFTYNKVKKQKSNYDYYLRALEYLDQNNLPKLLIFVQNGMGIALANEGRNDEALAYFDKSDVIFSKSDFNGKKNQLGFYFNQRGRVYKQMKNFDEALVNINKAIAIAEELDISDLKISAYYYKGEVLCDQKKWQEAESLYLKRISLQSNQNVVLKADSYKDLLTFYIKSNNSYKIKEYLPQYLALQDSAALKVNEDKYAAMDVAFHVQEKELQNELLSEQNNYQKNKILLFQMAGLGMALLFSLIAILSYRLRKHAKQLKKYSEYKDKILNVMGHDIRSPLITQLSLLQDLIDNKLANKKLALNDIYQLSLSVYKISDNVYNWVKRTRGTQNVISTECQIYYELLLVIEQYEPVFKEKKLNLHLSIDTIKESIVKGDRLGIQAVIRNLIDNASKYAPERGEVSIEMSIDNRSLNICISNDVIAANELSSKRKGLGLQLIKEILEFNDGKLLNIGMDGLKYKAKVCFNLV